MVERWWDNFRWINQIQTRSYQDLSWEKPIPVFPDQFSLRHLWSLVSLAQLSSSEMWLLITIGSHLYCLIAVEYQRVWWVIVFSWTMITAIVSPCLSCLSFRPHQLVNLIQWLSLVSDQQNNKDRHDWISVKHYDGDMTFKLHFMPRLVWEFSDLFVLDSACLHLWDGIENEIKSTQEFHQNFLHPNLCNDEWD